MSEWVEREREGGEREEKEGRETETHRQREVGYE